MTTQLPQDGQGSGAANLNAGEKGRGRRTLDTIFQHPLTHNLPWRDVAALVESIGSVEERHDGEFSLRAGDQHLSIKRPHGKDLTGPDVIELRHFLTRAGWSPEAPAVGQAHLAPKVIVVDHAGARIYQVAESESDGAGHAVEVRSSRHIVHEVDRKQHDTDRDETYPEDDQFFEAIADAVSGGGPIVVIGHGAGQSNEAGHLIGYLKKRHRAVAHRIVREITADLSHLTTPELLKLSCDALDQQVI
jgi:hypothetical protein